jgi:hypothetical protein
MKIMRNFIAIVSTLLGDAAGCVDDINFNYGNMFNWNNCELLLTPNENDEVNDWIKDHLSSNQRGKPNKGETIDIPKRFDGTSYSINTCTEDQADILAHILHFVQKSFQNDPLVSRSEPAKVHLSSIQ